jgi:hypothetical protein
MFIVFGIWPKTRQTLKGVAAIMRKSLRLKWTKFVAKRQGPKDVEKLKRLREQHRKQGRKA